MKVLFVDIVHPSLQEKFESNNFGDSNRNAIPPASDAPPSCSSVSTHLWGEELVPLNIATTGF